MNDDRWEKLQDDLATGKVTPEQFDAIAERLRAAERKEVADDASRQAAIAAYGSSAGSVMSPPRPPQGSPGKEATDRVRERLRKGFGAQDSQGRLDVSLMERYRIRDALDGIAQDGSSYRAPADRRIQDDRTARRGGR